MKDSNNTWLSPLLEVEGIEARFVSRVRGVRGATDRMLSLSALEPAHIKMVEDMGAQWSQCVRAEQVHGNVVKKVGVADGGSVIEGADGLVTNSPATVLGIYVADCGAIYCIEKKIKRSVWHTLEKKEQREIY